jgi:hypothetical protein
MGTRTRRLPEGTSASGSTSVPSFGVADASRAATRDIKERPLSHQKNAKSAKVKIHTKHIQDTEHLRPLSEHLAMHYAKKKKFRIELKKKGTSPFATVRRKSRTDAGLGHSLTIIRQTLKAAEEERTRAL